MSTLRLFASAREAAGTARTEIDAATVGELLDKARGQFGDRFARVLETSRVWVNGQPAELGMAIARHDVVAVLPPVSGGSVPVMAPPPPTPPPPPPPPTPATPPPPPPVVGPPPPAVTPPTTTSASTSTFEAPAASLPPERPARRLRLVPPPPPDDPADIQSALAAHPSGPSSMGRLALAPMPVLEPEPEPVAPPAPPPTAAVPVPVATPVGHQMAATAPEIAPDSVPTPAPGPEPKPAAPLAVVHHAIRPHGRLGLAWAVLTGGFLVAGPGWLSAWLAVIAFVAASQAATVWRKRGERPLPAFAAATAAALPLTAATGLDHMNMVVAGAILLTLVARMATPTRAPGRDVALTLVIGVSIGMAAAAPVLLRTINISSALYLLACAAIYDAGAYLVGTGASSDWEGPAAGVVALLPLTMAAAVVLVPPFDGGAPLLLGALAAGLAPFGPVAGSALLGDRTAFAPALRRIDSLLVMGPIWAWCAAALLT